MHSHTHTCTGSCHALRTHICLHIFRHLPHTTLPYSLEMRTRTHTHTPLITSRQSIFNADTEYKAKRPWLKLSFAPMSMSSCKRPWTVARLCTAPCQIFSAFAGASANGPCERGKHLLARCGGAMPKAGKVTRVGTVQQFLACNDRDLPPLQLKRPVIPTPQHLGLTEPVCQKNAHQSNKTRQAGSVHRLPKAAGTGIACALL